MSLELRIVNHKIISIKFKLCHEILLTTSEKSQWSGSEGGGVEGEREGGGGEGLKGDNIVEMDDTINFVCTNDKIANYILWL